MSPQEKAKELFEYYSLIIIEAHGCEWTYPAKQCVIKLCDEILSMHNIDEGCSYDYRNYYTEVKNELEKLLPV